MVQKRTYSWYVWPRDAHTNSVFSMNEGFEFHGEAVCSDKKKRQLWRCDSQSIDFLKRSSKTLHLKFMFFVQEGGGAIRPANFRLKTRRKNAGTAAAATAEAKRQ